MLSKILTKNNFKILNHLLKEEASLSELARRIKITKTRAFYSLKELEKLDWVRKTIQGKTHVYRFNFLHARAKEISRIFLEERKKEYNQKMKGLPALLDSLLKNMLKEKYGGCIFFGSSLGEKYKDIDVFVMAEGIKGSVLRKEIKEVDKKISLLLGTKQELEKGVKEEDMLYKNIQKGIPFGCEEFVLELKQKQAFLRRKDITERFVLGYREILSCLEFGEKEYIKKHFEKGKFDVIYAALNHFDFFPENDRQAKEMFKRRFGFIFSHKLKEAKKQAEKISRCFL